MPDRNISLKFLSSQNWVARWFQSVRNKMNTPPWTSRWICERTGLPYQEFKSTGKLPRKEIPYKSKNLILIPRYFIWAIARPEALCDAVWLAPDLQPHRVTHARSTLRLTMDYVTLVHPRHTSWIVIYEFRLFLHLRYMSPSPSPATPSVHPLSTWRSLLGIIPASQSRNWPLLRCRIRGKLFYPPTSSSLELIFAKEYRLEAFLTTIRLTLHDEFILFHLLWQFGYGKLWFIFAALVPQLVA